MRVIPDACRTRTPRTRITDQWKEGQELVDHGETGLLFTPGDVDDLARTMALAWDQPDYMQRLGEHARKEYEAKYTAAANYRQLIDIYEKVIARRSRPKGSLQVTQTELQVR